MWYMELRVKTKYVLGLPGGTQLGLEHGEKKPKDYDYQPADQPTQPKRTRNSKQQNLVANFLKALNVL